MVKIEEEGSEGQEEMGGLTLDELARLGAQRRLKAALEAEVSAYVAAHRVERDEQGRAMVVRNGHARGRKVTIGSGTLTVQAPRVDDRRVDEAGERRRFRSRMLPPYMRRSPKVAEVLPILYLRGLSTGDLRAALPVWLGKEAAGLSPTTITRLTAEWETERLFFARSKLDSSMEEEAALIMHYEHEVSSRIEEAHETLNKIRVDALAYEGADAGTKEWRLLWIEGGRYIEGLFDLSGISNTYEPNSALQHPLLEPMFHRYMDAK